MKYLKQERKVEIQAVQGRFESHDELKYSLRSVEKNVPWINHIYIVTDNQIPSWLNLENPKVSIIDHKEILPQECLPLFNSTAIEFGIANIPNLSEHFLYANDDILFGALHGKEFYFTPEGKPIHRVVINTEKKLKKYHIPPLLYWLFMRFRKSYRTKNYEKILLRGIDTVLFRTGKLYLFYPGHGIDPYCKSLLQKYNDLPCMQNPIKRTLATRFRNRYNVHRSIYPMWGWALNEMVKEEIDSLSFPGSNDFCRDNIDLAYISDVKLFEKEFKGIAKQLCVNDSEFSTADFGNNVKALLEKLFPQKSQFEK